MPSSQARFRDGHLQGIVRVTGDDTGRTYYGLASFRWFAAPSLLLGEPDEVERDKG